MITQGDQRTNQVKITKERHKKNKNIKKNKDKHPRRRSSSPAPSQEMPKERASLWPKEGATRRGNVSGIWSGKLNGEWKRPFGIRSSRPGAEGTKCGRGREAGWCWLYSAGVGAKWRDAPLTLVLLVLVLCFVFFLDCCSDFVVFIVVCVYWLRSCYFFSLFSSFCSACYVYFLCDMSFSSFLPCALSFLIHLPSSSHSARTSKWLRQ